MLNSNVLCAQLKCPIMYHENLNGRSMTSLIKSNLFIVFDVIDYLILLRCFIWNQCKGLHLGMDVPL